jgi:hypothetical protein
MKKIHLDDILKRYTISFLEEIFPIMIIFENIMD